VAAYCSYCSISRPTLINPQGGGRPWRGSNRRPWLLSTASLSVARPDRGVWRTAGAKFNLAAMHNAALYPCLDLTAAGGGRSKLERAARDGMMGYA